MDLADADRIASWNLREERNAQIGSDKACNRICIIAFENDFRMDIGERADAVGENPEAVARLHRDEGLIFNILQRCLLPVGQAVMERDGDVNFLGIEVGPGDVLHRDHRGSQAQVARPVDQSLREQRGIVLLQVEPGRRILHLEFGEKDRKHVGAEGMDEGKIDDAALRIIFMVELPPAFLDFRKGALYVDEETLPIRSEGDFMARAVEEGMAELVFQFRDGAGQGGLRDGNGSRRFCEVADMRKRAEIFQLAEIHGGLLYKIRDSFFV